jgi:outer membrane receptor protein involved in Fe transport
MYEERENKSDEPDQFAQRIASHLLPVSATYHHPNGVFAQLRVTRVEQRARFTVTEPPREARTDFSLTDLSLGYRLPGRHGVISLDVRNLFDRRFGFDDRDLLGNTRVPMFQPGRNVFLRFTFYP